MKKLTAIVLSILTVFPLARFAMAETIEDDGCYFIRFVDPQTNKHSVIIPELPVTLEDLAGRLASRGFALFLPAVMPEGFSEDALPTVYIVGPAAAEEDLAIFRTGEPDHVEILDGIRQEYWKIPFEVYDEFTEARVYYFSELGENWFGIIMRVLPASDILSWNWASQHNPDYPKTMNGFYLQTHEREGDAETGPYHWRQIYLFQQEDLERYKAGEQWCKVVYEILSDTMDMDILLQVAEGLRKR
ncbi:MAG: hypothetical protein FWF69_02020 [Firmicutes bacterium]|nr:hypothetical protein [Bacillota bacterium]